MIYMWSRCMIKYVCVCVGVHVFECLLCSCGNAAYTQRCVDTSCGQAKDNNSLELELGLELRLGLRAGTREGLVFSQS